MQEERRGLGHFERFLAKQYMDSLRESQALEATHAQNQSATVLDLMEGQSAYNLGLLNITPIELEPPPPPENSNPFLLAF